MLNTIIILVILLVFLRCLGLKVEILFLRLMGRGLSGVIVLYVCNFFLMQMNENFVVKINEMTLAVLALLGMPGAIFLYFLRWFLLILP